MTPAGNTDLITNYIYFYHLDKFCILPLYPESIADSMKSTFQSTTALSRSAPVFTYSNSGPRDVNIQFDLHRDLMNDVNTKGSNIVISRDVVDFNDKDYVDILINYLQAIALPKYQIYNGGKSKSVDPPMIAIRLGKGIFIKGVVTSGVTVTYKKPILTNGKYALISIAFTVEEVEPYDAKSIVQKGSFRDTAAGIKVNKFNK